MKEVVDCGMVWDGMVQVGVRDSEVENKRDEVSQGDKAELLVQVDQYEERKLIYSTNGLPKKS